MYSLKEIFYTIQGEGLHTGRPAVFIRFAGCNLWSGHEKHRASAICKFCDTEFVGTNGNLGGKYTVFQLIEIIQKLWPSTSVVPFIVLTGGEPAMQIDRELIDGFKKSGFYISIETNGTLALPEGIDWVCVSPKSDTTLEVIKGDELKFVFPQADVSPDRFEKLDFKRHSLQPMDGIDIVPNTKLVIDYCKAHPKWNVSLQTHKILQIP
ncbi:MAG: 7-carboxy-7-deazaguanine synthase [Saprospiraceae bacterium]